MSKKEAIGRRLSLERERLLGLLEGLSVEEMTQRLKDGGWSIKDILVHIASAEKAHLAFIKRMCEEDNPQMMPPGVEFDLDRWNASQVSKRGKFTLKEVLAELDEARRRTTTLLNDLTEEQLSRQGAHAVWGQRTVAQQLRIIRIHDQMHRRDVMRLKGAGR